MLAYPSLSEGFGLPILDGWATDTPVLTSDCTSLPEVAGNAALKVDPTDACQIAHGLTRLMKDSILRNELIKRGRQRLKSYSWQATAQRFATVIDQVTEQTSTQRTAA